MELNQTQKERGEDLNKKLKSDNGVLGKRIFNQIYEILKSKNNNYANILVNTHEIFKNNQAMQWEAKVKGQGIDFVLKELRVS